jgi:hypothetical protein
VPSYPYTSSIALIVNEIIMITDEEHMCEKY